MENSRIEITANTNVQVSPPESKSINRVQLQQDAKFFHSMTVHDSD